MTGVDKHRDAALFGFFHHRVYHLIVCHERMAQRVHLDALEPLLIHITLNLPATFFRPFRGIDVHQRPEPVRMLPPGLQHTLVSVVILRTQNRFLDLIFIHKGQQHVRRTFHACPAAELPDMGMCIYFLHKYFSFTCSAGRSFDDGASIL